MDLDFIEKKLNELRSLKKNILNEMNGNETTSNDFGSSSGFRKDFESINEMKIACIMDEFTFNSFSPECDLKQISPDNWEFELQEFKPDLFFLESAWEGKDGLWHTKVAFFSNELVEVLSYCKINGIPVLFWNKEDPVHFNTFISVARHADYVFTTDVDCIGKYKGILGHSRVYFLPFAAQPNIHNPLEKCPREDKFSFAGAYYKHYPERVKDLENILNLVTKDNQYNTVDIYDRNFRTKVANYKFPKKYQKFIRGKLSSKDIDKAYKGYRFNINMNSVKQSQSMCARRVFEVLGSNTVLVSNFSRAVRNLFGDLVLCTDDMVYLQKELEFLSEDLYYEKFRLAGLRKIYSEHTYRHRLEFISERVFGETPSKNEYRVAILAAALSREDIERIIANYTRQKYLHTQLFVVTEIDYEDNTDIIFTNELSIYCDDIRNQYDFLAFFSSQDYYGENYINDMLLAAQNTNYNVICKNEYYIFRNNDFIKSDENKKYIVCNKAFIRSSLIRITSFSNQELLQFSKSIDIGTLDRTCLSIDEFNYCMNYISDKCSIVDDLPILDTGLKLEDIHNKAADIPALAISQDETTNNYVSGCFLAKSRVLLITDNYPDYNDLYRYAFVHSRVMEYKKNGYIVDVFKFNERYPKGYSEFYGIDIMTGYYEEVTNLLMTSNYHTILIHFLSEAIWEGIKSFVKGKKIIVWLHGSEIQAWWRRKFNYTSQKEIDDAKKLSEQRTIFWRKIFDLAINNEEYHFHFIFVSNSFAESVFDDLDLRLPREMYSIIHNFINNKLFEYEEKDIEMRKNILSIRPFSSKTYANDLTVKTILRLSQEPFFNELNFRIIGQGELFKRTIKPIKKFKNVTLEERFLRQEEISSLHKEYGVFLVPSRVDSQGVSRDEAMSSGLVPVTNRVAAIPEFVDDDCGMVVDPEDFSALAESIKTLYHNPELFQQLSSKAAERVRKQSGYESTIRREIELIKW
ncbi:glycosyltransferase family protein [Paenibacillus barengoltzii]|uniref:glycosyltransferase family protein n=1 Tax=Paenibacillus barengoltzii TaxID=343517 RepID=UPI0013DFDCDD|nr:glycosyltransferase [Paenibacillus barengoltzii]